MSLPTITELKFPCTNVTRTEVQWRTTNRPIARAARASSAPYNRGKRGRTLIGFSSTSGYEGICGALTCAWLQRHLRGEDRLIKDGSELGYHRLAIAQSAYSSTTAQNRHETDAQALTRLMDIFDLAIIKNGAEDLDPFLKMVARAGGNFIMQLYFPGGSHFVGTAKSPSGPAFYYFEPYEGLYEFLSERRFNEAVTDHISAYYALNAPIDWRDTKLS